MGASTTGNERAQSPLEEWVHGNKELFPDTAMHRMDEAPPEIYDVMVQVMEDGLAEGDFPPEAEAHGRAYLQKLKEWRRNAVSRS